MVLAGRYLNNRELNVLPPGREKNVQRRLDANQRNDLPLREYYGSHKCNTICVK